MGLFLAATLATNLFGQDPSYIFPEKYVITLANGVKRLRTQVDSCESYVAQNEVVLQKHQEERLATEMIITSLKSTVSDYKEMVRLGDERDSARLIQIETAREESKPSWLESAFSFIGKGSTVLLIIAVAVLIIK